MSKGHNMAKEQKSATKKNENARRKYNKIKNPMTQKAYGICSWGNRALWDTNASMKE